MIDVEEKIKRMPEYMEFTLSDFVTMLQWDRMTLKEKLRLKDDVESHMSGKRFAVVMITSRGVRSIYKKIPVANRVDVK
jgi:hypothetical protein